MSPSATKSSWNPQVCSNMHKYVIMCNNRNPSHAPCLHKCDLHVQDTIAVRTITQMPKNSFSTYYYTLLHITAYITIIEQAYLPESWITKCDLNLIYETLQGKEVVHVLPITSILKRLPAVRAGDTWTIQFGYCSGCNSAHRYNHNLASADLSRGAGDSCPLFFVNSWVLGWSRDQ